MYEMSFLNEVELLMRDLIKLTKGLTKDYTLGDSSFSTAARKLLYINSKYVIYIHQEELF